MGSRGAAAALVAVVCGCGSSSSTAPTRPTAPAELNEGELWMFRVYASGIRGGPETVTTYELDEADETMVMTARSRKGPDPIGWNDEPSARWKLTVSRAAGLQLTLTARNGTSGTYACVERSLEVAPADAVRTSDGSIARWSEPTSPRWVQICTHTQRWNDGPDELLLADAPLEHLQADDTFLDDPPTLRLIRHDRTLVYPRKPKFNW